MLITSAWLFGLFMIGLTIYVNTGQRFAFMNMVRRNVPGGDKTGHFILMGALAFLVVLATARPTLTQRLSLGRHVTLWGSVTAIVIAAEECSQFYIPSRTFSLWDMAASLGGILTFSLLSYAVLRWRAALS